MCGCPGSIPGRSLPRAIVARTDRCTSPRQAWLGRVDARTTHLGRVYDTACTCNPDVNWTRFIVERVSDYPELSFAQLRIEWLLCRSVNGSARAPMKDVPSCDKPEGAARRRRTQDFRMGTPHRNCFAQWGTPGTETSQYRQEEKTNVMSLVTASERDAVQTESFGICGVLG